MTINETSNEIQTRNKDAEKIGEPRLRQIGRKDARKDDQRLKLNTVQSRLWQKLRTLNFFFWLFLDRTENKNELQG
jgi:hypothetical protein